MRYKNGEIGLHEVYYKRNGKIRGWTEEPILTGDKKSILEQLKWIKKDIEDTKNFILPYDNAKNPKDKK